MPSAGGHSGEYTGYAEIPEQDSTNTKVRTWKSWHRYTTLVLVAFAFLAILAAREPRPTPTTNPDPDQLPPLSLADIRRLLPHTFTNPDVTMRQALSWLAWRLLHQARARYYHYKRRTSIDISQ